MRRVALSPFIPCVLCPFRIDDSFFVEKKERVTIITLTLQTTDHFYERLFLERWKVQGNGEN